MSRKEFSGVLYGCRPPNDEGATANYKHKTTDVSALPYMHIQSRPQSTDGKSVRYALATNDKYNGNCIDFPRRDFMAKSA